MRDLVEHIKSNQSEKVIFSIGIASVVIYFLSIIGLVQCNEHSSLVSDFLTGDDGRQIQRELSLALMSAYVVYFVTVTWPNSKNGAVANKELLRIKSRIRGAIYRLTDTTSDGQFINGSAERKIARAAEMAHSVVIKTNSGEAITNEETLLFSTIQANCEDGRCDRNLLSIAENIEVVLSNYGKYYTAQIVSELIDLKITIVNFVDAVKFKREHRQGYRPDTMACMSKDMLEKVSKSLSSVIIPESLD